ncbi:hypothetical protein Pmani_016254 [Petrolisthes manimaculis]|uniref:Metalloendopeptidase n=1 Tax=Petrolisthes manimaculis TaxID=1843537 RepID=A0AAE1PPG1_9EUCA|nr:hypothetical protein Pmani_016254 [Petrolisthes manimaculis]
MAGLTPETLVMNTRVALKWEAFPEKRWPNATVPYSISSLYGNNEQQMIRTAIATLQFLTCIDFVEWDGKVEDYILFWPMTRPRGCWSYVGRRGGMQVVSLQAPDHRSLRCFASLGKPIHELLHALGIFHEQARPDRDQHVTILTENIITEYLGNFRKQSGQNTTFPLPYDYSSVMHYGSNFFSYTKSVPTIVPKVPGVEIGQRIMLSKLDCLKLNELYGCLEDPTDRLKYITFCNFLGISQLSS